MNPADLSLTLAASPPRASKGLPTPTSAPQMHGRTPVARIALEAVYTRLKAGLGECWPAYKSAINAFVLGNLNQAELTWALQPLLSPTPSTTTPTHTTTAASPNSALASPVSTLHLHNQLIACLYANTQRDPPPTEVAPWVVATDKPASTAKNAGATGANDKAEERLKREVMALHARDRRRITTLQGDGGSKMDAGGLREMQSYKHELAVKPPDIAPQSANGLTKTNWDLEIRRRYAQPLAAETLEFPTLNELQSRIEPICYEEGLVGGSQQGSLQTCAELVEQATEVYLKELLGELCGHARSNGEDCVQTGSFKKRLRKEEADAERGVVQRNTAGLLPVEAELQAKRAPLNMHDVRLALHLHNRSVRSDPFLAEKISLNRWPDARATQPELRVNGFHKHATVEGRVATTDGAMAAEEADTGWHGGGKLEQEALMGVLDDCLAVG